MKTQLPEKWIDAEAGEKPAAVAVRTLQNRLSVVRKLLPAAAKSARKDVEQVHQLRVWTRRTITAVKLYEDLLPRRRYAWMKKQLRNIRQAANDARDRDVLMAWLQNNLFRCGAKRWLKKIKAERRQSQESILAVHRQLSRGGRFKRRINRLLQHVHGLSEELGPPTTEFGEWSREHLRHVVEIFFAALPSDERDPQALHRFRICGKELRYTLELLAGAFSESLKSEIYPIIEALADRLGKVNDVATAIEWLRPTLESATNPRKAAEWQDLLNFEQGEFERARLAFWDWWSPQRRQDLRDAFATVLKPSPASQSVDTNRHQTE